MSTNAQKNIPTGRQGFQNARANTQKMTQMEKLFLSMSWKIRTSKLAKKKPLQMKLNK